MNYIPTTRSREFREGWRGRRRNYKCRECSATFQVDTLNPLPEIDRVCPACRERTYVYTFVNRKTGKEQQIRAADITLATLRAWDINRDLSFKPTPEGG